MAATTRGYPGPHPLVKMSAVEADVVKSKLESELQASHVVNTLQLCCYELCVPVHTGGDR